MMSHVFFFNSMMFGTIRSMNLSFPSNQSIRLNRIMRLKENQDLDSNSFLKIDRNTVRRTMRTQALGTPPRPEPPERHKTVNKSIVRLNSYEIRRLWHQCLRELNRIIVILVSWTNCMMSYFGDVARFSIVWCHIYDGVLTVLHDCRWTCGLLFSWSVSILRDCRWIVALCRTHVFNFITKENYAHASSGNPTPALATRTSQNS